MAGARFPVTNDERERLKGLALDVCEVFESVGLRCVLVLDGHGHAWMAATGETGPHIAPMLEHALKAAHKRNARLAN